MKNFIPIIYIILVNILISQRILIPMGQEQNDHLKAYGIAFWSLKNNITVDWLLNYKGGSFLIDSKENIQDECLIRGVTYYNINSSQINQIYQS